MDDTEIDRRLNARQNQQLETTKALISLELAKTTSARSPIISAFTGAGMPFSRRRR
jgi:hypothetical protein